MTAGAFVNFDVDMPGNYKTTEYLGIKCALDSIELQMLRKANCMKEHNILRESHVHSYKMQSVQENGSP